MLFLEIDDNCFTKRSCKYNNDNKPQNNNYKNYINNISYNYHSIIYHHSNNNNGINYSYNRQTNNTDIDNNNGCYLLNINHNNFNNDNYNTNIPLLNDGRYINDTSNYTLLSFDNMNSNYSYYNNKDYFFLNIDENAHSYNNCTKNININKEFSLLDIKQNNSPSKYTILNELKTHFHSCKNELKCQLLEINEPRQLSFQINNEFNHNHNCSEIIEKIELLKQFLENSLVNSIKNINDPDNKNINILDDMKDLINQINLTLQNLKTDPELKDKNSNTKKIGNRMPKVWKVSKLVKKEFNNTIEIDKQNSISNQKLKHKDQINTICNKNTSIVKNDENKNKQETKINFKKKKNKSVNNNDTLVFNVTSKKSLYSQKERLHKIDFEKFYNLIEKTKDILGTLNKYEKA
ncbi:hypothetical protein BCR36DRAFT_415716, partial [Piromyces finnis]